MNPIGYIESCYKDKFGVPRQPHLVPDALAKLTLRADLQPEASLEGLEGFEYIWLIWIFHQNTNKKFHAKVHPPRAEGKSIGIFATRSPHRPNPIGLSLVKLVKIEKQTLILKGVDLVDGTPILDIKPYLPEIESHPNARVGWISTVDSKKIEVSFSKNAEQKMKDWENKNPDKNIRQIVIDTIALDPRPLVYRGYEEVSRGESPYRDQHAFRIFDGDVHFEFTSTGRAEVFDIII